MDMNKMIKAFDMLIAESEKKGISIFKNQGIAHFIIECQEELQQQEAYDLLKNHIEESEDIFLERMGDDDEKVATVDLAILKLRHFIYKNHGIDALSIIQVTQEKYKPSPEGVRGGKNLKHNENKNFYSFYRASSKRRIGVSF